MFIREFVIGHTTLLSLRSHSLHYRERFISAFHVKGAYHQKSYITNPNTVQFTTSKVISSLNRKITNIDSNCIILLLEI